MASSSCNSASNPCRVVSVSYKYLNVISEGVYGVVHRALCYKTKEIVALKKIKVHKTKSGFPQSSFREINILNRMQHDNVVRIREVVIDENFVDVFMVMDYCSNDLQSIMMQMNKKQERDSKWRWPLAQAKNLMYQLLSGVGYLHSMFILHRDLKTSNLLLSSNGTLKICDFGMARDFTDPIGRYTNYVVTLWYRAPELLLAADQYGPPVDLWSVGCIFAELLNGEVLFPGDGEFAQISKIFDLLGTPTEDAVRQWPHWKMFPWPIMKRKVKNRFPTKRKETENGVDESKSDEEPQFVYSEQTVFLLEECLKYDPKERITATKALRHDFFRIEAPDMTPKEKMPVFDEHHTTRKEKRPDDIGDLNMTNDNEDAVSC